MKRHVLWLALALAILSGCDSEHDKGHEGHDHPPASKPHDDKDHKDDEHDEHDDHKSDEYKDDDEHDDHKEHGDEDKDHNDDEIHLSKEALRRSEILVEEVGQGSLQGALQVPAEIHLNPDRVAHISPLVESQLLEVNTRVGESVEAGQKLVTLRSVGLGQARADLSKADALVVVARKNFERLKKLRDEGISSERDYLAARLVFDQARIERRAAHSRLKVFGVQGGAGPDMELESPITGLVLERHATQGENVAPKDVLFVVADLKRVWVIGRVYERQISRVRAGMKASVTLTAYPERRWEGVVDYVSSSLDETSRTLAIRVELDNPDGLLRPGLFGALLLEGEARPDQAVVLVPEGSVQALGERRVVFKPQDGEEGAFKAVEVKPGRSAGGSVEILEGLTQGDKIVTRGAFVLKSELVRSELGHGHAH